MVPPFRRFFVLLLAQAVYAHFSGSYPAHPYHHNLTSEDHHHQLPHNLSASRVHTHPCVSCTSTIHSQSTASPRKKLGLVRPFHHTMTQSHPVAKATADVVGSASLVSPNGMEPTPAPPLPTTAAPLPTSSTLPVQPTLSQRGFNPRVALKGHYIFVFLAVFLLLTLLITIAMVTHWYITNK